MERLIKSKKRFMNAVSPRVNFILNLIFIIYSAICVAPLVLVFMVSITDEKTLATNGFSFLPKLFSLDAYRFIFNAPDMILNGYKNSILVTVIGTILSLMITSMLAYPLSRKELKYRKAITFFVFFTMLFNGGLVPWFMLYKKYLHLYNTPIVLVVPYLVNVFNVIIMRTFFALNVPDEIIESAKMDGANDIRIFFSMITKISLPAFATIGLFNTLGYWNDWYLSLLFIRDDKFMTIQYLMYSAVKNMQAMAEKAMLISQYGGINPADIPTETVKMGMAIIGMGPIIFAYPFFQKYFVKGLTLGAIKG